MAIQKYAYGLAFQNQAARLAYVPQGGDLNKVAKQFDDNTYWVLISVAPATWSPLIDAQYLNFAGATRTLYVRPTGNDANDGSSVQDAVKTLTAALDLVIKDFWNGDHLIDVTGCTLEEDVYFPQVRAGSYLRSRHADGIGGDTYGSFHKASVNIRATPQKDVAIGDITSLPSVAPYHPVVYTFPWGTVLRQWGNVPGAPFDPTAMTLNPVDGPVAVNATTNEITITRGATTVAQLEAVFAALPEWVVIPAPDGNVVLDDPDFATFPLAGTPGRLSNVFGYKIPGANFTPKALRRKFLGPAVLSGGEPLVPIYDNTEDTIFTTAGGPGLGQLMAVYDPGATVNLQGEESWILDGVIASYLFSGIHFVLDEDEALMVVNCPTLMFENCGFSQTTPGNNARLRIGGSGLPRFMNCWLDETPIRHVGGSILFTHIATFDTALENPTHLISSGHPFNLNSMVTPVPTSIVLSHVFASSLEQLDTGRYACSVTAENCEFGKMRFETMARAYLSQCYVDDLEVFFGADVFFDYGMIYGANCFVKNGGRLRAGGTVLRGSIAVGSQGPIDMTTISGEFDLSVDRAVFVGFA